MNASVLVVCTGNVCRSPAAAALLRARLDHTVSVHSAGTSALVDSPADSTMQECLAAVGVSLDQFRARQLDDTMITSSTLILTATTDHRRFVVSRIPAAVRRTYTLREFAALSAGTRPAGTDDATHLHDLLQLAPRRRRHVAPTLEFDVDDPYRRGREAHARALAEIDEAVTTIVEALHHDR